MAAKHNDHLIAEFILETFGVPVISQETADAITTIWFKQAAGIPIAQTDMDDVRYALAVALDAAEAKVPA